MELRHIFLVIALFAASVIVMPEVYSLFAGQHFFYLSSTTNCFKCHADVRQEVIISKYHSSFTCENCHRVEMGPNSTHDKAITPRCLSCHSNPPALVNDSMNNLYVSPVASVFGENITNLESHNPFIEGANSSLLMTGENEACVSCHTTKSVSINVFFSDTYVFNSIRTNTTWQLSNFSKKTELTVPVVIESNESADIHDTMLLSDLKCEKCHYNIRGELNDSMHHTYFSCSSCHRLYSVYHAASTPPCMDCHGSTPKMVTDMNGNTLIAPQVSVYTGSPSGADAHIPFVLGSINSNVSRDSNIACSSCHSSFNNNISFTRPSFIEWDVEDVSGVWTIQNLAIGVMKEIKAAKRMDGKMHNISSTVEVNCVYCHGDISEAVISGGHSNEQWRNKHDFSGYGDMNSYCQSCHKPLTQNNIGTSPYPQYPFNSPVHGAMTISCMDCHSKSGSLFVNIDGMMQTPKYNSTAMGNIESSIAAKPVFIRSYLCIACKNTNNSIPNPSLHFKLYTEPQVTIYVNGTQRYP